MQISEMLAALVSMYEQAKEEGYTGTAEQYIEHVYKASEKAGGWVQRYDLGPVTAYGEAVAQGFTGSIQEWYQYIKDAAENGQNILDAASLATAAAATARHYAEQTRDDQEGHFVRYDEPTTLLDEEKAQFHANAGVMSSADILSREAWDLKILSQEAHTLLEMGSMERGTITANGWNTTSSSTVSYRTAGYIDVSGKKRLRILCMPGARVYVREYVDANQETGHETTDNITNGSLSYDNTAGEGYGHKDVNLHSGTTVIRAYVYKGSGNTEDWTGREFVLLTGDSVVDAASSTERALTSAQESLKTTALMLSGHRRGTAAVTGPDMDKTSATQWDSPAVEVCTRAIRVNQAANMTTELREVTGGAASETPTATLTGPGVIQVAYGKTFTFRLIRASGIGSAGNSVAYTWQEMDAEESRPTPEMFGAAGDGVTDDTGAFAYALENVDALYLGRKAYGLTGLTISAPKKSIIGQGKASVIKALNTESTDAVISVQEAAKYCVLRDFLMESGGTAQCPGIGIHDGSDIGDSFLSTRLLMDGLQIRLLETGIRMNAMGSTLTNTIIDGSADAPVKTSTGLLVTKSDNFISNVRCANHAVGIELAGSNNQVANCKSNDGYIGWIIRGNMNILTTCSAQANAQNGVEIHGVGNKVDGTFSDNGVQTLASGQTVEDMRQNGTYRYANIKIYRPESATKDPTYNLVTCTSRLGHNLGNGKISMARSALQLENTSYNLAIIQTGEINSVTQQHVLLVDEGEGSESNLLIINARIT